MTRRWTRILDRLTDLVFEYLRSLVLGTAVSALGAAVSLVCIAGHRLHVPLLTTSLFALLITSIFGHAALALIRRGLRK
jgi:hypothetical protein